MPKRHPTGSERLIQEGGVGCRPAGEKRDLAEMLAEVELAVLYHEEYAQILETMEDVYRRAA